MAKAKTKTMAAPAAQSKEEAESLIARMGDLQRDRARAQADYGDAAARLKADAEAKGNSLTQGGKVKFGLFTTGKVQWRSLPPKVTIRGADKLLEAARRLGLTRFIRVKEEPNKEAMLAEPELAATLPGVTIGSAGEEFAVEPFEPELVGAAA